jgi:hypothetical protein
MLQDILAHRRSEIDSIDGAVVRAARDHNIPVPHTEMLSTLVSLIDARQASHPDDPAKQQTKTSPTPQCPTNRSAIDILSHLR